MLPTRERNCRIIAWTFSFMMLMLVGLFAANISIEKGKKSDLSSQMTCEVENEADISSSHGSDESEGGLGDYFLELHHTLYIAIFDSQIEKSDISDHTRNDQSHRPLYILFHSWKSFLV